MRVLKRKAEKGAPGVLRLTYFERRQKLLRELGGRSMDARRLATKREREIEKHGLELGLYKTRH